ncbi:LysR substrate-binding domain-containing protein [Dactylosporangium sp. NPDC051484]|uniref:LysR substrate-binding domain-containing protein n=1 Tax=Dactylosporangium sp. NPDC051484 TaxID=3154942 RepID=UPI00344D5DD7
MLPLPSWTPDLPALDLLISIAELGSIGRAAAAHNISQPSASNRLARLERQVGAALIARGARGSELTFTGEAVLAWARPVVESARQLADGIAALRADRSARLRIAASLTVAEYLVPRWLLLLRRSHADLVTSVEVINSHGVVAQVRLGAVDVGFVETPEPPNGVHSINVGRDRVTLVVAAEYPLANKAARRLPPRDVLDHPLLLRESGSGTRDTFLSALSAVRQPAPTHTVELGSTATIIATVLEGGGVGVVSARAVTRELAAGSLVELHLDGVDLHRPLHAIWTNRRPAPLAAELIDIARQTLERAGQRLPVGAQPRRGAVPREVVSFEHGRPGA